MKDIGNVPRLTPEEEYALGMSSKPEDKQKLTEANMRLIPPIVEKYKSFGLSYLDMCQEASIGLFKAA